MVIMLRNFFCISFQNFCYNEFKHILVLIFIFCFQGYRQKSISKICSPPVFPSLLKLKLEKEKWDRKRIFKYFRKTIVIIPDHMVFELIAFSLTHIFIFQLHSEDVYLSAFEIPIDTESSNKGCLLTGYTHNILEKY